MKIKRFLRSCETYNMLKTNRRIPLNTIVLPPISPPPLGNTEIIQQVWVNKSKSGSVNGELVAVSRSSDAGTRPSDVPKGTDTGRVAQLEQNIRFLQEQHQQMLSGLHKEIDSLRHRNRELQFQLVFTKGTLPSSPSSPEDDIKPKVYLSPKQVNVMPLQVEILEKELGELKIQLQDIETRNTYLSAIVEEQKKKLERYERDRERELERTTQPDPELLRKLDDAETLIRRLRRENSEFRREASANATYSTASSSSYQREGGSYQNQRAGSSQNRSNGRHRGNGGSHYRGNWFPPLHAQTYWHGGRGVERNATSAEDNTTLPSLMSNPAGNAGQYHGRRGSNNNHYHNGEGRKYKSAQNRAPKPS